ncbi:hypothetical protein [Nocardia cyriacigeorgica]|uniref:hypothetical protein n=1 Tax=Nocardia cyriacigeorgica TaxID=135487 RepID=UPI002457B2E4|nr:hypothetical protein [Nocardia cyriacigeorgica]
MILPGTPAPQSSTYGVAGWVSTPPPAAPPPWWAAPARQWVEQQWRWDTLGARLRQLLS